MLGICPSIFKPLLFYAFHWDVLYALITKFDAFIIISLPIISGDQEVKKPLYLLVALSVQCFDNRRQLVCVFQLPGCIPVHCWPCV